MKSKMVQIIAQVLETEVDNINEGTLIVEDLGAHSLDIIEFVTEIEDTFKVTIPDEEIPGFKTVADIIAFVENCLN